MGVVADETLNGNDLTEYGTTPAYAAGAFGNGFVATHGNSDRLWIAGLTNCAWNGTYTIGQLIGAFSVHFKVTKDAVDKLQLVAWTNCLTVKITTAGKIEIAVYRAAHTWWTNTQFSAFDYGNNAWHWLYFDLLCAADTTIPPDPVKQIYIITDQGIETPANSQDSDDATVHEAGALTLGGNAPSDWNGMWDDAIIWKQATPRPALNAQSAQAYYGGNYPATAGGYWMCESGGGASGSESLAKRGFSREVQRGVMQGVA